MVEYENIKQVKGRWHLMKTDIAYRNAELLPIDIAVLLIGSSNSNPTLERTRELRSPIFNKIRP